MSETNGQRPKPPPVVAYPPPQALSVSVSHSESVGKLFAALAKAQGAMVAAAKDKENPFFRSSYADLASVWDACRAALSANDLAVVQMPSVYGNAVTVSTYLGHGSGEWIEGKITLLAYSSGPQDVGGAITYARRYGLAAAVGVAPDDDDDGNLATHGAQPPPRQPRTPVKPKETPQPPAAAGVLAELSKLREQLAWTSKKMQEVVMKATGKAAHQMGTLTQEDLEKTRAAIDALMTQQKSEGAQ